jgi:hypothetical protein
MANRAERRRSMKISELREQAIEAMDQTPYIDVEAEDEAKTLFRVWHPLLQDDEAQKRIDFVSSGEDLDKDEDGVTKVPNRIDGQLPEHFNIRTARAILGPQDHKRFLKAGGRSNDIQLAWAMMVRTYEEMLEDESDPKDSE